MIVREDLVLDQTYILNGDSISISQLKFFVSDMSFYNHDTLVYVFKKKHHLVDLTLPSSTSLTEKPESTISYDQLKFNIGIDSLTNISGAIEGDLDPTSGMYWTWQSGYINFKLEGSSPKCPTRHNKFQWHIGGYLPPFNTLKEVVLSDAKTTNEVKIEIHIGELLQSFDLNKTHQIMSPNARAVEIANRLATIFKLGKNAE
jgi:hypothetical protein